MLPRVHKHIDGGHQWLSWALGRERALRGAGVSFVDQKYVMPDGAVVHIRINQQDSSVVLRSVGGGLEPTTTFAVSGTAQLHFSVVNQWSGSPTVPYPKIPPPPEPPGPCPPHKCPPAPTFTPAEIPEPELDTSMIGPGDSSNYPFISQWRDEGYEAAVAAATAANRAAYSAFYYGDPPIPAEDTHPTSGAVLVRIYFDNPVSMGGSPETFFWSTVAVWEYRSEYSTVPYWDFMWSYRAWDTACREGEAAANEACAAPYRKLYREWQEERERILDKYNGEAVCTASAQEWYALATVRRNTQIAALNTELSGGLTALPVYVPAMQANYVPNEAPANGFSPPQGTISDSYPPSPNGCPNTTLPVTIANGVYVVDSFVWGGGEAPPTNFAVRTDRAFGYSVTGAIPQYGLPSDASNVAVADTAGYAEWLASPRAPGTRRLDFDLLGTDTGGASAYVFLFEFYAWDHATEVWYWTPSLALWNVPTDDWCRPECNYHKQQYTDTVLAPVRPGHVIEQMRLRSALKHNAVGRGWGPPEVLSMDASVFTLDVRNYDVHALPDFIAVLADVPTWKSPNMSIPQGYYPGVMTPEHVSASGPQADPSIGLLHSLYANCFAAVQAAKQTTQP